MALGPKDMGAAILRNLPQKTGKTLDEWLTLIAALPRQDKKSLMTALKSEHGLGHFQAQTLVQHHLGTLPYRDGAALERALFSDAAQWRVYTALREQLLQLGSDVRVQPCKTYVPFYRRRQFAVLWPSKKAGLCLGMSLPEGIATDLATAGSNTTARITHQVALERAEQLADFIHLVHLAYQHA